MDVCKLAVDKPVGLESYPRINGHAYFQDLRINGHAFTHKRSRISYMYLYITCNSQPSSVHNASALHTATAVLLRKRHNSVQGTEGIFLIKRLEKTWQR